MNALLRRRSAAAGFGMLVLLLMFWSLLPIGWNLLTSVKTRMDIFAVPPKLLVRPDFSAYGRALAFSGGQSVWPNMINSSIIAMVSTVLTVGLAALAAYAFSRYTFRGRLALLYAMLGTRLLPPLTTVIPLFLLMSRLHLIDTHAVLIIIYTALNIPFATWLIKSFFDTIPRELEEAGQIDGCSGLRALWHITMPLAAPGLAASAIFVFVLAWNEFTFAYMFTSSKARTLPLLIAQAQGDDQIFWQDMAAQATILMILPLLVVLLMQRQLVRGLTAGALK
jgi:multiple sugar transport system permease protein